MSRLRHGFRSLCFHGFTVSPELLLKGGYVIMLLLRVRLLVHGGRDRVW